MADKNIPLVQDAPFVLGRDANGNIVAFPTPRPLPQQGGGGGGGIAHREINKLEDRMRRLILGNDCCPEIVDQVSFDPNETFGETESGTTVLLVGEPDGGAQANGLYQVVGANTGTNTLQLQSVVVGQFLFTLDGCHLFIVTSVNPFSASLVANHGSFPVDGATFGQFVLGTITEAQLNAALGFDVVLGTIFYLANQFDPAENGFYIVTDLDAGGGFAFSRIENLHVCPGLIVQVQSGTLGGLQIFVAADGEEQHIVGGVDEKIGFTTAEALGGATPVVTDFHGVTALLAIGPASQVLIGSQGVLLRLVLRADFTITLDIAGVAAVITIQREGGGITDTIDIPGPIVLTADDMFLISPQMVVAAADVPLLAVNPGDIVNVTLNVETTGVEVDVHTTLVASKNV